MSIVAVQTKPWRAARKALCASALLCLVAPFASQAEPLVAGSPGGSRIITIFTEIILDIVDFGMNIAEATEAVRIHHKGLPDELQVERGLPDDTIRLLEALGHKVVVHDAWGSAQSILLSHGALTGAADPRQRGTLATGY